MTASNEELPLEYRQYVPEERRTDAPFIAEIAGHVRGNLSMMASLTGDTDEFASEVQINYRESRKGGFWVHGALARPACAEYLDRVVPPTEYAFTGEKAIVHEPVDLSQEAYLVHLQEKRAR